MVKFHLDQFLPEALPLCVHTVEEEVSQVIYLGHRNGQIFSHFSPVFCLCNLKLFSQSKDLLVTISAKLVIIVFKV